MASILETFVIHFEADADDVKKGTDKAKKSTDDLNKSLKQTDLSSQKLGTSFKGMIASAAGAFAAILSVGAFAAGSKGAAQYTDEIGKLSQALDIGVGDADAWTGAVIKSGGSATSFASSAKRLNASLAEFATKGSSRASPFLESLGISMTDVEGKARKVVDVLPELADEFSKISKSEALGIGEKIGLDQATILTLTGGRSALDDIIKRQKELGVVTKQDKEIAEKFNDQMSDTKTLFRGIFTTANSALLPALTSILKGFEKFIFFMRKHSGLVKGALIGIGTAIAVFVVPPLITAAAAALTLYAPFLLIGAAVAALIATFAILYEDITRFLSGQSSFIGDILKKWPIIGVIVEDVSTRVKNLWSLIKLLGSAFLVVGDSIVSAWNEVIDIIKSSIDVVMGAINAISNAFGKVKKFFGGEDTEVNQNIKIGQEAVALANSTPFAAQSTTSIVSASKALTRNTSVQTGDINIQTNATDAQGISSAIGSTLSDQMRKTVNGLDDGVLA